MKFDNLDNLTIDRAIEIIKTLTAERDEARRLYCEKMSPGDPPKHAEKWRWDCYGKFEEAQQLKWRLEEAIEERDEARREVSFLRPSVCLGAQIAHEYAKSRGWDCFKEDALDRLHRLDEECGL
jgi:hypothetical protein